METKRDQRCGGQRGEQELLSSVFVRIFGVAPRASSYARTYSDLRANVICLRCISGLYFSRRIDNIMGVAQSLLLETFPPATKFSVDNIPDLTGKIVVVTGANSGQ